MSYDNNEQWHEIENSTVHSGDKSVNLSSPYNFVEPPNKVLETPWGNSELLKSEDGNPTHERPYAEAISGSFEVDWTFEEPFLIGGTEKKDDFDQPVKYDGEYVIPGASIRGMLRNVLEITTATRITLMDREKRFAFRDFSFDSNLGYKWLHVACGTYFNNNQQREAANLMVNKFIKAGYLVPPCKDAFNNKASMNSWKLIPCEFARIEKSEAWQLIRPNNKEQFSGDAWLEGDIYKRYKHVEDNILKHFECNVGIRDTNERIDRKWHQANPLNVHPPQHRIKKSNKKSGTISLVGDGVNNTSWLFHYDKKSISDAIDVPQEVMENFIDAHSNDTGNTVALDFWQEINANDASQHIPVLYIKRDEPGSDIPLAQQFFISLSRFLKMPHAYSIGEMAENSNAPFHKDIDGNLDFVQALFGHIPDEDVENELVDKPLTQAWKTRVFFRHGALTTPAEQLETKNVIGATCSPRASFSPYYLRPKAGESSQNHWSDKNARLAGVKRYPIRKGYKPFADEKSHTPAAHESKMCFVKNKHANTGTQFRAPIKLHNVHPIELGGLLWAIGFCGLDKSEDEKIWRHAMGRGKPRGYGQLRGELVKDSLRLETGLGESLDHECLVKLVQQFEAWLCENFGVDDITEIDHILELRAMANPEIGHILHEQGMLQYPEGRASKGIPVDSPTILGHKTIKEVANKRAENNPLHLWRYPRENKP
jgi:CRISPR-associated protein (TIGR03986 family)